MQMRDTTVEANNKADMADYYLYHSESEGSRWALAIEQPREDRYNVSVMYQEPGWDVFGVIRYWTYVDRAEAEARYLQLQGMFKELDEGISIKAVTRNLPATEPRPEDD